jgi:hypothetical protein
MSWTLTIPVEVPSQNQTNAWHWSKRHKHSKRCGSLLLFYGANNVPKARGKRRCHILAFRRQRCHDIANLVGGAKGLVDALVRLGLLLDDKDSMAELSYDQSTLKHSPTPGVAATVITLEDINPAS